MYEIYCQLRDKKGVKDADIAKCTDITKSTFSDWKTGRSTPKNDKLQKIADYFEVSLDYLINGENANDKFEKEQDNTQKLLIKIQQDKKMINTIEKFYKLNNKQKEHVIELINLFVNKAEEEETDSKEQ